MSDSLRVLGQLNPASSTLSTLYTVPSQTQTTTSSLIMCNSGSGNANVRVSIAVAGAADNIKQYIYYDHQVTSKESHVAVLGMTLNETDVVKVYASTANVSFNLFGVETTRE